MWELTLTRTQMFHPKPGRKSFVRTSVDFKSILANMILSEMIRLMSFSGRDERKQKGSSRALRS